MKNPGTLTGEVINSLLKLPLSPGCLYTSVVPQEGEEEGKKKKKRGGVMRPALASLVI